MGGGHGEGRLRFSAAGAGRSAVQSGERGPEAGVGSRGRPAVHQRRVPPAVRVDGKGNRRGGKASRRTFPRGVGGTLAARQVLGKEGLEELGLAEAPQLAEFLVARL